MKIFSIDPHFPLIDNGSFSHINMLDRIFNGHNMARLFIVDQIYHRRERGGFSGSDRTDHQEKSLLLTGQISQNCRHNHFATQLIEFG